VRVNSLQSAARCLVHSLLRAVASTLQESHDCSIDIAPRETIPSLSMISARVEAQNQSIADMRRSSI